MSATTTAPTQFPFPNLSRELALGAWDAPDAHQFRTFMVHLEIDGVKIYENGEPTYYLISKCKCGAMWEFEKVAKKPDGPCPATKGKYNGEANN